MTLFTIRKNSSDPLIMAAGIITVLFILDVLVLGTVEVRNATSFTIQIHGISLTAASLLMQIGFIIPFIGILGFSKTFIDLLDQRNLALILANPISRREFLCKNILGVVLLTLGYCLCTSILFGALFFIKAGVVPVSFLISIQFLSVGVLALYVLIICFGLISESYAVTVFVTFIYTFAIQPFFLSPEMLSFRYGIESQSVLKAIEITKLLLPNSYEGIHLMNDWLKGAFETTKCLAVIISVIPLTGLSFLIMKRKEF